MLLIFHLYSITLSILVSQVVKKVAGRVDSSVDDDDLMELISFADASLWSAGKWWGSEREVNINAYGGMIAMPPGYGHMIGVNLNGQPSLITGRNHQWHLNGPGSSENYWDYNVLDLGEHPTSQDLRQPTKIGVSLANPNDNSAEVIISGSDMLGRKIISEEVTRSKEQCGELVESTIYGVKLKVEKGKINITSHLFSDIDGIYKNATLGHVDIWAVYGESIGVDHLATLEPGMTSSGIRRYRLPDTCSGYQCVHALVKVDEPGEIVSRNQAIVTPSINAIVYEVIAQDFLLNKKDVAMSEQFHALALRQLDQHLAEKRGHQATTIQMSGPGIEDQTDYGLYFQ